MTIHAYTPNVVSALMFGPRAEGSKLRPSRRLAQVITATDPMLMSRVSLAVLVALFLSLGGITPAAAQTVAQRPDSALGEAQLTAYAKAFAAISTARDQAHAELALPRNKTDEIQRELRAKLQKEIDQILREQHLTQAQFARITYVISSDAVQRKSFEEILARVNPKPDAR